ncbi:MAG: class I SAM-dependent methyltransferase [Candidatus Neomarinimicrobiota bacterium]
MHTRSRYRLLPRFFRAGSIDTLDAGCGNGALGYAAYQLGNCVLGVTNDPGELERARDFFSAIGADSHRMSFENCDLYDLPQLGRKFDQIICSETLEHIKQDEDVIRNFYEILRPGGVLHLCCPFALHSIHNLGRFDEPEDGGHVRDGYTLESYQGLLVPAGFEIVDSTGLGSSVIVNLDRALRWARNRAGDVASLPLFLLGWPLQLLDTLNPDIPYSLYVQAVKPQ